MLEPGRARAAVYVHDARFNQPNDLAIAPDGTLYASDPSSKHHSGRIWRIERGADARDAAW